MDHDGGRKRHEMDGSQHIVFRLFVPAMKAGPIIGKEGSNIKALREETRARIKISSPAVRGDDRILCISTRDGSVAEGESNTAEVAFLRVYPQALETAPDDESTGSLRLLVAASQAGALIGRGGATIKSIREASGAGIRIVEGAGQTPHPGDRICTVSGKVSSIQAAVTSIISILNKNPAHEQLEELEGTAAGGPMQHGMAAAAFSAASYAAQHTASLMAAGGTNAWPYSTGLALAGGGLPGAHMDDPYTTPGAGIVPGTVPMGLGGAGGVQSLHTEMRVPSSSVGAILGRGGTTINNIRQLSGAQIKVRDSDPGSMERSVEISGNSQQVATAQSLISACVAQSGPPRP